MERGDTRRKGIGRTGCTFMYTCEAKAVQDSVKPSLRGREWCSNEMQRVCNHRGAGISEQLARNDSEISKSVKD